MILSIDIGNTHITGAFFTNDGSISHKFRLSTKDELTEDEIYTVIKVFSDYHKIDMSRVIGIGVSSVASGFNYAIKQLAKRYFHIEPFFVSSSNEFPFGFATENPAETGADRLSNIAGALYKYKYKDLIIIDFGTATTFEVVKNSDFLGGFIIPGINMSAKALFNNTSKLPSISIHKPDYNFGNNTSKSINAGIYYGYVGQIKELISCVRRDLPEAPIIATGGLFKILKDEFRDVKIYDPDLTLYGVFRLCTDSMLI